ncbi:hypothetical protein KFK09_006544 [Dendrobium nobile]|uniref:Cucumisin n=1 Tax=Dendrobium nobile TaxID=94219 RepID=A0A8T3BUS4_DENNO|nr:hypothetical protein KFK09_006544 [Dendrobium nobile]
MDTHSGSKHIDRKIIARTKLGNGEEITDIAMMGRWMKNWLKGKVVLCDGLSHGYGPLHAAILRNYLQGEGVFDAAAPYVVSFYHAVQIHLPQYTKGTSMACPHIAGAAAYVKSFKSLVSSIHKSALITTDMEELVSVFPSKQRKLHTTRSWNFMGFPSTALRGPFESDVIIGMIDTGIWPESKSFDDAGFGPPPSRWKGICQSNHNFTCNNKIIGARYYHLQGSISEYDIPSPRDSEGHGTHTSSTAAGRLVTNTSLAGIAGGTARGGVPSARIAIYKVCWSDGCSDIDLLAAFEDAIQDGVDIISISIGGNSGPDNFTVENYAPWILTVAASTIDRKIIARTKLGNGEELQGKAVNIDGFDGEMHPLIFGGNAPNISAGDYAKHSRYCYDGTLDEELVKGKVVLCDGLSHGYGPLHAGVVGFVLPVSVLESSNSIKVQNYANKTSNPTATIYKSEGVFDAAAPYVVSFSSRGPNPLTPNILKPDLTAPGVDILAAWSPLSNPKVPYNIISGTSMACPHIVAYVMSSTKNAEAELAYGAGHINPLAALSPGLIYDAQEIDYIKMLCGEGYFSTILRLVTGDQSSCDSANNGTVLDLNYPTFALQTQHGKSFSTSFRRIVTNVGVPNSTYYAIVNAPSSLKINVEPNVLYFKELMEKKSFSIKLEGDAYETIISGVVIWSDGTHKLKKRRMEDSQ